MSRWRPDARERLKRAALELFTQQGFAATTVPEITARAGLTTRTFFRHFTDKREVLFAGDEMPELTARLMAETPESVEPADLIVQGLRSVAESLFDGRREEVRERRGIIRSDESLQERDLHKRAALRGAIQKGFTGRGVAPVAAALFAETGVTLLSVSLDAWLDEEDDRPLFDVVLDTLESLRATTSSFPAGLSLPGGAEAHEGPGPENGPYPERG